MNKPDLNALYDMLDSFRKEYRDTLTRRELSDVVSVLLTIDITRDVEDGDISLASLRVHETSTK